MKDFTPENRHQRKAEERKAQILRAAADLFSRKGFSATTTREIALAADLSEGTIYNYFENKEHIFATLLENLVKQLNSQGMFTKTMPTDPQSFIDELFEMQHRFLLDNQTLVEAVLPEIIINEEYREIFVRNVYLPTISFIVLQLQARGVLGQFRPVNHELTTRILVGLLYGLSFLHVMEDPVVYDRWDSLLGQTISLIFDGLSPV